MFLDSRTTAQSVGDQLAQEMGVTRHEAWDDPARSTAGPWARS